MKKTYPVNLKECKYFTFVISFLFRLIANCRLPDLPAQVNKLIIAPRAAGRILTVFFLLAGLASNHQSFAQTQLIPVSDGGFETGSTFALNGWAVVNDLTNSWYVGVATAATGTRGAYIDQNTTAGTANVYSKSPHQTSHFYRDVAIPAGGTNISLSFQLQGSGEVGYDRLLVYTAPTSVTPVASSPVSSSTTITGATLVYTQAAFVSTYTTQTIILPNSLAGTTVRLIFTWQNDGNGGTNSPAALDNISLTYIPVSPPSLTTLGSSNGCPGTSVTINGTNLSGATSVTIGGTAVSSITSNSATQIIALIASGTTGNVVVTNIYGTSNGLSFTVNPGPPAAVGVITGSGTACPGSALTYSVAAVANATAYTWTVPTGWNIVSGQGTININVTAGSAGQNGNISVSAGNSCGTSLGSQSINITPSNGTDNTGYAGNSGSKISGTINVRSASPELRGYLKFLLSGIPSGSTITSSVLKLTNNGSPASSGATNEVKPLALDPVSATAANIYTGIGAQGSGANYSSSIWSNSGTISLSLSGTSNADIQTGISTGYIAMGLARNTSSSPPYIFDGYGDANPPILAVTYTGPKSLPVTVSPGTPVVPGTISGSATPCKSSSVTYSISAVTNATSYTWTVPAGWTITAGQGSVSMTVTSGSIGQNGNINVTATNSCGTSVANTLAVTINQDASISLNSSGSTTAQTLCINTAIAPITYLIGGSGTGATLTGPAGLLGSYNTGSKIYTVSGSPTISGGPFTYTVTTTGPCANSSLSGTITVTPDATITLTSASGTDAQTVCMNSGITNITYSIGGSGTTASITAGALPAGVTGAFSAGVFTISGTPIASGSFSYTITTTGPCVKPIATGTIIVNVLPTGTFTATETSGTVNDNIICSGAAVTFKLTPSTYGVYIFKVNGVTKQSGTSNTFSSGTLINGDNITVDVANGFNCGVTFGPMVITVISAPIATLIATENSGTPNNNTICVGDNVTFTAGGGTAYNFKVNGSSVQSGASNTYSSLTLANGASVTVDVSNSNGCITTSAAQVITANSLPTGTLTSTPASATICPGANITFTASGSYTTYEFKVNGTSVQGPLTSNTFSTTTLTNGQVVTVIATNSAGCSATFNPVPIAVNVPPSGTITTTENSNIANDYTICAGSPVSFTATTGFTNYQFYLKNTSTLLQGGASNIYTSSTLVTGDYVTVAVTNGCSNTFPPSATITVVPMPSGTLTVSPASAICNGDNVTFTATADPLYTYNFQVNGATVQTGSSNLFSSATLINGDKITVDVTGSNSCAATFGLITMTVRPLPTGVLVPAENSGNTANDGIICTGATVVFTAPTGFSNYNFLLNGTPILNGPSNTYSNNTLANNDKVQVAVTNGTGCVGLLNIDTITVNPLPAVASITGTLSMCLNSSTTLSDVAGGGVWFSLNTTIATVDVAGVVTGLSAGTATITYTVTNTTTGCSNAVSAIVTVNAPPTVAPITGNLNDCVGGGSQLSDATAAGTWSSNNTPVATVNSSGLVTGVSAGTATISYTVTDGNGCSTTVTAVVTVNTALLVAPITGAVSVCENNTTVLLDVTTGGSWSSSNATVAMINASSGLVTGLTSGTTTITYSVTDACSNAQTSSLTFTVNPAPTVVITNPLAVCSPSTIDLTSAAVTAGSSTGLTFTYWTNAAATTSYSTPTAAGTGTWYIKGTAAAGCFDIKPVTVTVNPKPTMVIVNPAPACSPATVDLTLPAVTAGSTSGLTYTYWTDAGATVSYSTPATAGTGTYYIKGTSAAGCFDIKPVTVSVNPIPTVLITNPAAVCSPSTANLTFAAVTSGSTAGLTFTYFTDAAATIVYSTPVIAGTGTYYVKGTTASGCFNIKPVTVTVNPKPTVLVTNPSPVCAPSSVNITLVAITSGSTAGLTFTYFTDAAATIVYSTPTTAGTGTYYIKGTLSTGCYDIKAVTVTVNLKPTVVITNPVPVCSPATVNITLAPVTAGSTAGLTFTYYADAAGTIVYNTPTTAGAGTYYIKGTTAAGCTDIQPVTVTVNALPAVPTVTPATAIVCQGSILPLISGTSASTTSATFSSGTINLPIPDDNATGAASTIAVSGIPAGAVINSVSVNFDITHTFDQDLIINLKAPNASVLNLVNTEGAAGTNFTNTIISSNGVTTIIGASAPFTGTYKAGAANAIAGATIVAGNTSNVTAFASLFGTPNGNWVFSAVDNALQDSGKITNWSITVNYTTSAVPQAVTWSPVTDLYTDAGATTAYAGQSLATVYTKPGTPGSVVYTATATNASNCINSATVTLTVNPVPAVTIFADYCVVVGKVRLTASSTPAGATYVWSTGQTGSSIDVDIADDYTVVASYSTGCSATAIISVAQELVINGDFSAGNTGFTSPPLGANQYHYKADNLNPAINNELNPEGLYGIGTDGQNYHANFWGHDHTTGTGNFMIINGFPNGNPQPIAWQETVNVLPNTAYYFSAWGMSVNNVGPFAQLQFNVNGTQVGSAAVLAAGVNNNSNNGWTRFYGTLTTGPTTTTAIISITDLQTALGGNDFGLDDISFATLSTFVQLVSAPGTDAQTPCINTPITPIVYSVGSTASGPTITGLPPGVTTSFNGVLFTISGAPTVAGDYTYTVTTTGSCLPTSATGTIKIQGQTIALTSGSTAPVCINTSLPNIVYTLGGTATGAAASGLPTGITGAVTTGNTFTINGIPTVTGTFNYSITTTGTCNPVTITGTLTVQSQTITLNSANNTQTVCINSPIANIQYTVGGTGTGASVTGLPPGITGAFNSGLFIISGSPTSAAGSPFNYIVTTSGPCATVAATGTITVTPGATIILTSGTNPETVCKGSAFSMAYTVANGTNASVTAGTLPAGVTGGFSAGVFTISGTPAVSGTFNFTITAIGGCGSTTKTGTIIVQEQTISLTSGIASPLVCVNVPMTNVVYTLGGTATGATISGLPTGIGYTVLGNLITISGTPTVSGPAVTYIITTSGTCGTTTATGAITVQPTAIGGTLASVPICSGVSGTLSLAGQVGTIVRWEYSTDGGATWTPVANTTTSLVYPGLTAARMYRAVVGNGCGNVFSSVVLLGIHNLWTGATSTNWNTTSNWSDNQAPSISCPLVYIPNTTKQPILSSGAATINNIQISSGATLTINGTGTLQIAGTITNSGIFDASSGAIEFNGTSSQTIAGSTFQGNAINDLVISNTAGVTLGGATDVYRSLTYGATNSKLNTGGFLTLKSTATQTAWIGNMTGHTINGDVTVERYIATGTTHAKSWQLLAVPTTGQTIKQSWQEGATATNVSLHVAGSTGNPFAGYGTMLTSDVPNATMQSTPGFDAATAPGPSIKVYNSATNGYVGPTSTGIPIYNQKGYFILVRGDRSIYTSGAGAVPTVLRTKGTLFTPSNLPPSTTVLAGKSESVGNPYASAIDLRHLTLDAGVNSTIIVWDPTLGMGSEYGLGAYQTLYLNGDGTNNGTNNYVNLLPSIAYGPAGTTNNNIQSGQAFIIQALPAVNGNLSFTESTKANGSKLLLRSQSPLGDKNVQLRTTLYGVNASGTFLADGTLIQYNDAYSDSIDGLDARKMGNSAENLAIKTGGILLAIERRHTITQQDTIFLNLTGVRVQAYHFEFIASNLNTGGLQGYFEDNYLHTRASLDLSGTTVANFSVENIAGSYARDRFRIVFAPSVVLPVTFTSIKGYLQDKNINVEWSVENEMNIKQYEVEKSTNGTQFARIAVKAATANGGHSATYVTTDANPLEGYNYYRVKSVDINGKTAYTNVVKVLMGSIKQDIVIYPNPITDGMIHLQLMNQPGGKYGLRLLNRIGQVIVSRQSTHAEGNSTELIKWDFNLAHGIYVLEVTKPDGTQKNINVVY